MNDISRDHCNPANEFAGITWARGLGCMRGDHRVRKFNISRRKSLINSPISVDRVKTLRARRGVGVAPLADAEVY